MSAGSASGSIGTSVVVGAGVAGLLAARALRRAGDHVTVLDGGATGGAVTSRVLDGLTVDVGAEGFATRGGAVTGLVEELGLADHLVEPSRTGTWVQRSGAATRIPDGAVLGIPTHLDDDALDQLGSEAAERARQDAELPVSVGADADTLGALVRARMGDAVARAWLAPLVAGVHRLDVEEIPPELLLPGVRDRLAERGSLAAALGGGRAPLAGLRGGVAQLVDALVGELTTTGVHVLALGASAVERDGTGWRVRTGDGGVMQADRLLLACPPWTWPTGLPEAVAACGRTWPEPRPVDLLTLVVAHDGGGRRAGVVVAADPLTQSAIGARALTYSSAKWDWLGEAAGERVVLRLTYDGREVADDTLAQTALADAAALTGARWSDSDLLASDRTRWLMPRTAVEPGMAGHRNAMTAALAEQPTLAATGGWLVGTGLAWVVSDAPEAAQRLLGG